MSDFKQLARRYQEDASFHLLVKALYKYIDDLHLSPSEIREAAMFACYMHEMENPRPIMVGPLGEALKCRHQWTTPLNSWTSCRFCGEAHPGPQGSATGSSP